MPYIDIEGRRSLFVHIPKCGGTTVERYLEKFSQLYLFNSNAEVAFRYTPQHFTYADAACLFPPGYFSYSFAICRNPYCKIASEYRFQAISRHHRYTEVIEPFPVWVGKLKKRFFKDPFFPDNHLRLQSEFVSDAVKIFHLEDGMDNIMRKVCEDIGIDKPKYVMERQNDTSGYNIDVEWTEEDKFTIYQIYKQDFDTFGYEP